MLLKAGELSKIPPIIGEKFIMPKKKNTENKVIQAKNILNQLPANKSSIRTSTPKFKLTANPDFDAEIDSPRSTLVITLYD